MAAIKTFIKDYKTNTYTKVEFRLCAGKEVQVSKS
jgi:hypothetical protein